MDKDIELAKQAKFPVNHPDWADAARRFAALIRADEREACAKVCDEARAARLAEKIRAGVTPSEPPCWCHKCNQGRKVNGVPYAMTRMILCPDCGNKRCPKASDHALQCTSSNAPNQPGSMHQLSAAPSEPVAKPLTDEQIKKAVLDDIERMAA